MRLVLALLLAVAITACAAKTPLPLPDDPCASVPGEDAVDGGIGGTGKGVAADCGNAFL